MPHDLPSWKAKLREARAAALASMTPEEAAQREADDAARRGWRAERRAARAAEALLVNQRAFLGDTPEEIAARLGITSDGLRKRARRWGHVLVQREGFRRLSAWVANRHVWMLDTLTAETGLSRDKVLETILAAILGDPVAARRIVGAPVKRRAA
jgi:hypothetical protein